MLETKLILIDGYNVIKNTPELALLERRSLGTAREALVRKLIAKYRHTPHQVVVVFDGQEVVEKREQVQRVRLIYTCQGVTADEVIARLACEGTDQHHTVVVASNDQEVRGNVTQAGGHAASSDELAAHLSAPPSLLAQRARHRQGVLRRLEGSSTASEPAQHTKGNPRHAKRHKRGEPPQSPL